MNGLIVRRGRENGWAKDTPGKKQGRGGNVEKGVG